MKSALKFVIYVTALVCLPLTITFARADDHSGNGVWLDLSSEAWLQARSSEVSLSISLAPEQFKDPQKTLREALSAIDSTTDWHITSFRQPKDQTGLMRWQVSAQARLAVARLATLPDAVEKTNKPGLRVTIGWMNQDASLEERDALMSQLRQDIYRKARDERDRLNGLDLGESYVIKGVYFNGSGMPRPQPRLMRNMAAVPEGAQAMMADAMPKGGAGKSGGFFPLSRKMHLSATVVLAPEGGND